MSYRCLSPLSMYTCAGIFMASTMIRPPETSSIAPYNVDMSAWYSSRRAR